MKQQNGKIKVTIIYQNYYNRFKAVCEEERPKKISARDLSYQALVLVHFKVYVVVCDFHTVSSAGVLLGSIGWSGVVFEDVTDQLFQLWFFLQQFTD